MNAHSAQISVWTLKIGFLISIVAVAFFITQSSLIATYPYFGTAITIDMLATLPIAYFLFIRNTALPNVTVLLVFGASALAASFLLPANDRELFDVVAFYAVPVVELIAFTFVGWRIFRTRRAYTSDALLGRDLFERTRSAFTQELHPAFAARVMAFELSAIVYALFKWPSTVGERAFTYHRKSNSTLLLSILLFLLASETAVLHILIALWNVTAAWIATAASVYFAFQILAHLKSLRLRPIEVTEKELLFRCGLLGDAAIELDSIIEIEVTGSALADSHCSIRVSPLGTFSQPNVRIQLSRSCTFSGFYGIQKPFDSLGFFVDEPQKFADLLQAEINR